MYLNVKTRRQKDRTKGVSHKSKLKAKNRRRRQQIKA
jgi:hypothetical protein